MTGLSGTSSHAAFMAYITTFYWNPSFRANVMNHSLFTGHKIRISWRVLHRIWPFDHLFLLFFFGSQKSCWQHVERAAVYYCETVIFYMLNKPFFTFVFHLICQFIYFLTKFIGLPVSGSLVSIIKFDSSLWICEQISLLFVWIFHIHTCLIKLENTAGVFFENGCFF